MKLSRARCLLISLLFTPVLAHGAPPAADTSKQVDLKADTLSVDVQNDTYRAEGSVHMVQDGVSLIADSVVYHRLTGDAQAQGNVFMQKLDDTLKGDTLTINLVSQKGSVSNAELFIKKPNFHVRGKALEKTGDEDYHANRATFTTCDGDNPSWRFEARDVKVTLDEYATARDAVFYAGDVPLLYTPYLIFPAKRERQSGLLIPKFGHSSKKGLFIDQPYYWAINPSQDATFDLDLEGARGAGAGVDYRYLRPHGSEGRLQAFGIYDTNRERFRGELQQRHLEIFSPSTTLISDVHLISDRSYYKDFGELTGEYNKQYLETVVALDHNWERYAFSGGVRYDQDLLATDNDATLQRLPELSFIGAGQKVGPLFFSMASGFTNFERTAGVTGQRLELHPRFSAYANPAGVVDVSLYGGYRERLYNASGPDAPSGVREIGQADAGAVIALPLERIYDGRVRHLLIPSVQYGYVQHRNDEGFPFFDYDDRVLGQSVASWSIANVFTRKVEDKAGAPEYRDLVSLKLSQGYQFSGERRDLLTLVDEGNRLTDLMLESKIYPIPSITVEIDGRYNAVDNYLSTGNVAVEWKGEGKYQATAGYRFSRQEVEYAEARLAFPMGSQFSANVLGRYSIDGNRFLESKYAVEYKRQCWSVIGAYSYRPGSDLVPGNREFTINFALAGLGALGSVKAF